MQRVNTVITLKKFIVNYSKPISERLKIREIDSVSRRLFLEFSRFEVTLKGGKA